MPDTRKSATRLRRAVCYPTPSLPTWEEVYADADWDREDLKYYWQKWDMDVKEYDNSYHEKRDQMGFEMAEKGDKRSISVLQRIVARDTDPAKRERAVDLLATLDAQ